MTTINRSIVRLSVLGLGALLIGLPARAALAEKPTTAPDAEAKAQNAREQADYYRSLGGVGYKTGLEQRADAEAARYATLAQALAATPELLPVTEAPSTQDASSNCVASKPSVQTPDCKR